MMVSELTEGERYHFYKQRAAIVPDRDVRGRFASTLVRLREAAGMSRAELREAAGVKAVNLIRNYEERYSEPTLTNFIAIADALGVTLDELAGRPDAVAADLRRRIAQAKLALGE